MEIQEGPFPPDKPDDGPPPDAPPSDRGDESPSGMDPKEAIAIIQKLGIPPEALPILAKAIDALEQAGAIPSDSEQDAGPPQGRTIDDAFNAAIAQHGMPPGAR